MIIKCQVEKETRFLALHVWNMPLEMGLEKLLYCYYIVCGTKIEVVLNLGDNGGRDGDDGNACR